MIFLYHLDEEALPDTHSFPCVIENLGKPSRNEFIVVSNCLQMSLW